MTPIDASTALLLRLDADTADTGPCRRGAGTLYGAAALAAAAGHPLGLAKALSLADAGLESGAAWPTFGAGDVDQEMECWLYPRAWPTGARSICGIDYSFELGLSASGRLTVTVFDVADGAAQSFVDGAIALNTWAHLRASVTVDPTNLRRPTRRLFVNGVKVLEDNALLASVSMKPEGVRTFAIGRWARSLTANPNALIAQAVYRRGYVGLEDAPASGLLATIDRPTANSVAPSAVLRNPPPAPTLRVTVAGLMLTDYGSGGRGRITGTVVLDLDPTPVDPPLRRRVLLIREDSGLVIRQTWSDAATGAYEFRDLDMSVKYTTVAHWGDDTYRAAIASGLTPTAMF